MMGRFTLPVAGGCGTEHVMEAEGLVRTDHALSTTYSPGRWSPTDLAALKTSIRRNLRI
jgi:hypothetical protein